MCWGVGGHTETMRPLVIVQDPLPASQRVPSAGWIRVALGGGAGGPEWAPCLSAGCGPGSPGTQCPTKAWPASMAYTPSWLRTGPVGEQAPPCQPWLAPIQSQAEEAARETDPI